MCDLIDACKDFKPRCVGADPFKCYNPSTQQKLHKLQDDKIKCNYCDEYKSLDKIQASPTTVICVECAEEKAEKNEKD